MKKIKIKKCNNLYILAILAILALLFIIIMSITMKMKESLTYKYIPYAANTDKKESNDFLPTHIERNTDTSMNKHVMYKDGIDYPDNDIMYLENTTYTNCLNGCINEKKCIGIVTNFEQDTSNPSIEIKTGKCLLKNKMDSSKAQTNRFSTILNRDDT